MHGPCKVYGEKVCHRVANIVVHTMEEENKDEIRCPQKKS